MLLTRGRGWHGFEPEHSHLLTRQTVGSLRQRGLLRHPLSARHGFLLFAHAAQEFRQRAGEHSNNEAGVGCSDISVRTGLFRLNGVAEVVSPIPRLLIPLPFVVCMLPALPTRETLWWQVLCCSRGSGPWLPPATAASGLSSLSLCSSFLSQKDGMHPMVGLGLGGSRSRGGGSRGILPPATGTLDLTSKPLSSK